MKRSAVKNHMMIALIVAVLSAFFGVILFFRSALLDRPAQYPVTKLNDGWKATVNGVPSAFTDDTPLDMMRLDNVRIGDTWTITNTLPDGTLPAPALYFYTLQAVIDVRIDGETVYSYGETWHIYGNMLKRGFCLVNLPADYQGKEVAISFTATEHGAFTGLAPVLFGNEQDLMQRFMQERRLPLFVGLFLSVYAILQILWMPYLLLREGASYRPLFGAFISLLCGLYVLGYYHLFDLFTSYTMLSTYVEYSALYLLPCAICAYLVTMLGGGMKRMYQYFVVSDIAMIVMIVLLHVMNLVHITSYLIVFYMITLIESLPYLVLTRGGRMHRQGGSGDGLNTLGDRLIYFGFAIFAVFAVIDGIFFMRSRFIFADEAETGIPFITIGSLFFTMALTAQYYLYGVSHLRADVTRERLEERAYTDPLTGLANRIRTEQEMQQLKISDPFVIVSLDMDGLKKVNDTLGHAEGDRMLSGFAQALRKCFGEQTLIGRMGGDEFLVILTGSQCTVLNAKLRELERMLFDMNLEERRFYYSVSYGYATNEETHYGRRVRDIYMLADRRMYDMKRKRKQEKEAEL